MPPTISLSILNAKAEKGHNCDKINPLFFFSKVNQVMFSAPISSLSFKAPAHIVIKISCSQKKLEKQMDKQTTHLQYVPPTASKLGA